MRKKLTVGWIIFAVGILLDVVSDVLNIWPIGILAGILWLIGMVIGINALVFLKQKNTDASAQQLKQEERTENVVDNNDNNDRTG